VPFYVAASTTETDGGAADDQTFTRTATTANSGPNDIGLASNWYNDTEPTGAGDTIRIPEAATDDLLYGMDIHSVALAAIYYDDAASVNIGSDDAPFYTDADFIHLDGTGQIFLRAINVTGGILVTDSGGDSNGYAGTNIKGTAIASVTCQLATGKSVNVGDWDGGACTCDAVTVDGGTVNVLSGVAKAAGGGADLTVNSGIVATGCAIGTVNTRGTYTHETGAATAINATGGTVNYNSSTAATLLAISGQVTLNVGPNAAAPTATDVYG
jgi:hypothetical protein